VKGKAFATTFSDFDSSNSDTEGECDSKGNYRAFMTIASINSKNDLSKLVDELGDLFKDEEIKESEDKDVCQNEGEINLQEAYDSLLKDCGKYAKVANLAVKKMKKVEEEHRCILVQLKEVKCEVEGLKGELVEAYSKISFLNLKLSKLISRLSISPPRNLTTCCLHKNLHMIRFIWAIPEKEALEMNPKRK